MVIAAHNIFHKLTGSAMVTLSGKSVYIYLLASESRLQTIYHALVYLAIGWYSFYVALCLFSVLVIWSLYYRAEYNY